MKRWLVLLLVVLALVVFVAPGMIGRLTQENVKQRISMTVHEEDVIVTEERLERGWFTTDGRHRIELTRGGLHDLVAAFADDDGYGDPAIVVDTRVDHGPVPFTSMSRESGTLVPALATAVSSFALDTGDGELVEFPGKLYSHIGLSGATSSRFALQQGAFQETKASASWSDGQLRFTTDAAGEAMRYAGALESLAFHAGNEGGRVGGLRFEGNLEKTAYGFGVGSASVALAGARMSAGEGSVALGPAALEATSELREERVAARGRLSLSSVSAGELDRFDLRLDAMLEGLDAAALGRVYAILTANERAEPTGLAWPILEAELRVLAARGGELGIERLQVDLPDGRATASLQLELPEKEATRAPSWASLLLALSASAHVEVPAALVERLLAAHPDAGALIATGVLERRGEMYVVEARYAQGVLNVNGAPVPIRLPGR